MNDFAHNLLEELSPVVFTKPQQSYAIKKPSKLGVSPTSLFDYQWFLNLNKVRREVVSKLAFNFGMARLLELTEFIDAIRQEDFEKAADQMLDTDWAAQTGRNAFLLARQMKFGVN